MAAAAHNPSFAKKLGIPQKVAKEFNEADQRKAKGGEGQMIDPIADGMLRYFNAIQKNAHPADVEGIERSRAISRQVRPDWRSMDRPRYVDPSDCGWMLFGQGQK